MSSLGYSTGYEVPSAALPDLEIHHHSENCVGVLFFESDV